VFVTDACWLCASVIRVVTDASLPLPSVWNIITDACWGASVLRPYYRHVIRDASKCICDVSKDASVMCFFYIVSTAHNKHQPHIRCWYSSGYEPQRYFVIAATLSLWFEHPGWGAKAICKKSCQVASPCLHIFNFAYAFDQNAALANRRFNLLCILGHANHALMSLILGRVRVTASSLCPIKSWHASTSSPTIHRGHAVRTWMGTSDLLVSWLPCRSFQHELKWQRPKEDTCDTLLISSCT